MRALSWILGMSYSVIDGLVSITYARLGIKGFVSMSEMVSVPKWHSNRHLFCRWTGKVIHSFIYLFTHFLHSVHQPLFGMYSVSQKKIPRGFLTFFPKRLGIYMFLSTLDCKFLFSYLQLWRSDAILSATSDHPACVSADGGYFEHTMWTGWSRLIWHNFVKVADNWTQTCSLA